MSEARFFAAAAAPGARIVLTEETAHHAVDVLRLRREAAIRVFDGAGNEYHAVIEEATRRRVTAHVMGAAPARAESLLRVVLALPPLRGDRMELVVQKATELGVAEIWPVLTARTDAVGRPALSGSRHDRWMRVAIGAAEQSGRAIVPRVAPTVTFDAFLATAFTGSRFFFSESLGASPLGLQPRPHAALAFVGPPGGLEPTEIHRLAQSGWIGIGLGPRVLRSETAAVVAVAALQVLWGDLS